MSASLPHRRHEAFITSSLVVFLFFPHPSYPSRHLWSRAFPVEEEEEEEEEEKRLYLKYWCFARKASRPVYNLLERNNFKDTLKDTSFLHKITSGGKRFHALVAVEGKARPPKVDRRQRGRHSRLEEADRRLARPGAEDEL